MNFFTNSILNIVLTLFNSSFSDSIIFFLCAIIFFENLYSRYYVYKICKGKVDYPILYVLPLIGEIKILKCVKKKKYICIRDFGLIFFVFLLIMYFFCLLFNNFPEEISYLIICMLAISTVLFAVVNARFIFTLREGNKNYYSLLGIIGLYFLPLFTLIFLYDEVEEEKKKGKACKIVSKVLALVIFINTIYGSTITSYASQLLIIL